MALKLTIGCFCFFFPPGLTSVFSFTLYKRNSSSLPPGNVGRSRFGPTMVVTRTWIAAIYYILLKITGTLMDPQTTRVVGMICFPFHDEFPWNSVCSLGPPSWVCFAPPDTDRTSTCTLKCLQELDRRLQTLMNGETKRSHYSKPRVLMPNPFWSP